MARQPSLWAAYLIRERGVPVEDFHDRDLPCRLDVEGGHRGLRLIEERGTRLTFRAEAAGAEPLTVIAVDPATLTSA